MGQTAVFIASPRLCLSVMFKGGPFSLTDKPMIDTFLRVPKEHLLEPLAARLEGVPPTRVTLVSLGVGLGAAGLAGGGLYGWGLGLWLLNRLLDGLDGEVARRGGRQSDLGGYLDILCDFLVYALVPVALVFSNPSERAYLALALLLTSFYVNAGSWMFLSALLEKRRRGASAKGERTSVTMPGGLIEGAETVVFYSLFFLFPHAFTPLALLMAGLVAVTAGQRVVWARRVLE